MERFTDNDNCTLHTSDRTLDCLNLGSYNYLGFADDWHLSCKKEVLSSLDSWPISMGSARCLVISFIIIILLVFIFYPCNKSLVNIHVSRCEAGSISLHDDLEKTVARFLNKEAAIVYTMVLTFYITHKHCITCHVGVQHEHDHDPRVDGSGNAHRVGQSQPHQHSQRSTRLQRQHSRVQVLL